MAQIIQHKRGVLEDLSSVTPNKAELLVVTGSSISALSDGLVFVGNSSSELTIVNRIITGSSSPDLTGASYSNIIDGIPFYNTTTKKLEILAKAGNTNVVFTKNSLDLNGSGIFSSSAQLSGDFLDTNGDSVVSGSGQLTDMSGDVTVNSSGVSAIGAQKVINSMLADDAVGADELASNAVVNDSVASSAAIAFSKINSDGTSIVSGSSQVVLQDASKTGFTGASSITTLGTITAGVWNGTAITNANLANSAITIAGNATSLGGTVTLANITDESGIVSGSSQISVTNSIVAANAAIDHTKLNFDGSGLTSGSLGLSIAGGSGTDTAQVGVDTLTFAGTANEIVTAVTNNTVTFSLPDDVTVGRNLTVVGDLEVQGTTTTINSTTVSLGDNIIALNGTGAALGGIEVHDENGPLSGSFLWNGASNHWVAGQSGSEYKVLLSSGDGVVSGSAQIALSGLSDYDANDHIDHTTVSVTAGNGLTGGGTIAATRTLNVISANNGIVANADNIELATASSTFTGGVKTKLNAEGVFSSSAQLDGEFLNTNGDGVVSGSAQIALSGLSDYDSNDHIDHTTVSVTAGSGLTGGGTIASTRTLNVISANNGIVANADNIELATASSTFTSGVKTKLNTETVISGSSQVNADSITNFDTNVKTKLNAETVISGSAQVSGTSITNNTISGIALGSNLANLTVDNTTIKLNSGTTFNGGTAKTVSLKDGGISNSHINASAAIDHTKLNFDGSGLTSGSLGLTISDGSDTDSVQVGVDTLAFAGTANEILTTVTNNTVTFELSDTIAGARTFSGDVSISGDLTVSGTRTIVDSSTLNISGSLINVNFGGGSVDGGLQVADATGDGLATGSLLWDGTNDYWKAGIKDSEKRVIVQGATAGTSNKVSKFDAAGTIINSTITDDGTNVSLTGELTVNGLVANSFVVTNSSKQLLEVTPGTAGDTIQWNGSSFVASNTIDGGTF